jgi:signal transduction histidine kinase
MRTVRELKIRFAGDAASDAAVEPLAEKLPGPHVEEPSTNGFVSHTKARLSERKHLAGLPAAWWNLGAARERRLLTPLLLIAVALGSAGWVLALLFDSNARLAAMAPSGQAGLEAASALARLFGALVIYLFPTERGHNQLRWVAGGLLVLGIGGLVFGFLPVFFGTALPLEVSLYESLAVWTLAAAFFFVGFLPRNPPPLTRARMLLIMSSAVFLCLFIAALQEQLPTLLNLSDVRALGHMSRLPVPGLTPLYWVLSSVSLVLLLGAVIGASRTARSSLLSAWLLLAMILLVNAQLHNMIWPSTYTPLITTSNLIRFAFGLVVAVAAMLELLRVAAERAALLRDEQERTRRLSDLAILKANFSAMAAHELHSPLGAIRGYAAMLSTHELTPSEENNAIKAIEREADILGGLAEDVQAAAIVERDDFSIELKPIEARALVTDARAFVSSLPGEHPLMFTGADRSFIRADGARIRQVIRNLLGNAAKYSSNRSPIELSVERAGDRVRISVIDKGIGITSADMYRIFQRFGRGRNEYGGEVPGVGLGLYLSRRIVQAHGSDLHVESEPGSGSRFWFDLEAMV